MFDISHIHPILVHFPVALTLLGVLLESIAVWRRKSIDGCRCGEILLYFAALSAIVAAVAGGLFTPDFTNHTLAQAKNTHSSFAGVSVALLCVASAFYLSGYVVKKYKPILRNIGFIFYLLSALAVAVAGFLGGALVYNDMLHM